MDDTNNSYLLSRVMPRIAYTGRRLAFTLEGRASCPATGKQDVVMRSVFRVISPDKHIFEMYDASRGNAKTMEITYTRQ